MTAPLNTRPQPWLRTPTGEDARLKRTELPVRIQVHSDTRFDDLMGRWFLDARAVGGVSFAPGPLLECVLSDVPAVLEGIALLTAAEQHRLGDMITDLRRAQAEGGTASLAELGLQAIAVGMRFAISIADPPVLDASPPG